MSGPCPAPLLEPQRVALAKIGYCLEGGDGVALLCGPSGVGKSTVLAHLVAELNRQGRSAAVQTVTAWLDPATPLTGVVAADDAHLATEAELAAVLARCRSQRPAAMLVLAGEGRLLTLVGRNPGLTRAVRIRAALLPGSLAETQALVAGDSDPQRAARFSDAAVTTIHEIAGGTPADIVRLANLADVVAASRPDRPLTVADIEAIHRRLSPHVA
jgi:energy-coupling factor transporter ATP-binding protein EcfA2